MTAALAETSLPRVPLPLVNVPAPPVPAVPAAVPGSVGRRGRREFEELNEAEPQAKRARISSKTSEGLTPPVAAAQERVSQPSALGKRAREDREETDVGAQQEAKEAPLAKRLHVSSTTDAMESTVMGDEEGDQLARIEALRQHPELGEFYHSSEGAAQFQVDERHMTIEIAKPLSVEKLEGISPARLVDVFSEIDVTAEMALMWRGYDGQVLFMPGISISYYLRAYRSYLSTAPCDVKEMAKCIAYQCLMYPDKYDLQGIGMTLAQNGGVCNVQKEIGIRAVYASMMGSMLEHVKVNAVETKILTKLKMDRLALSEKVAMEICEKAGLYRKGAGPFNSHFLIPLQNKLSNRIGIDRVEDKFARHVTSSGEYEEFMKVYTVEEIVRSISGAVNDTPRLIKYEDLLEFLEKHRPAGVDAYDFLSHFVFEMETGKFTEDAIKFALLKLNVLKIKTAVESVSSNDKVEEPKVSLFSHLSSLFKRFFN